MPAPKADETSPREDADPVIADGYCRSCAEDSGCHTEPGPGDPVVHVCTVDGWEVPCCGFPAKHENQRDLTPIERELLGTSPAAMHHRLAAEGDVANLAETIVAHGVPPDHAFGLAERFVALAERRWQNVRAGREATDDGSKP